MFQFEFRQAEVSDAPSIQSLMKPFKELSLYSEFCCSILIDHYKESTIVATYEGSVVGFAMAHPDESDPEALYLWQVIVAPRFRGLGIMTQLLQNLVDDHQGRELKALVHTENKMMTKALFKFAKKHDFQIDKSIYQPDQTLDTQSSTQEILWSLRQELVHEIEAA